MKFASSLFMSLEQLVSVPKTYHKVHGLHLTRKRGRLIDTITDCIVQYCKALSTTCWKNLKALLSLLKRVTCLSGEVGKI